MSTEFGEVFANIKETLPLKSRLFGYTKNEVDIRLVAYDEAGHVIFDTDGAKTRGADFSQWHDVRAALDGKYGSRWELDRERERVNLYSTLPVMVNGKVAGAVSVVKPTNRIRNFISHSLDQLLLPGAIALALAAVLAYALSGYITRIVGDLAWRAERVAAGEPNVRLQTWTRSELGVLARAVQKMREKLEGKAYVEEMASNFSHELKTPLASIRGAAELLENGAINDPPARTRFLGNIRAEVERLDRLVSNFLKLSRIEAQTATHAEPIDLTISLRETVRRYVDLAQSMQITIQTSFPDGPVPVRLGEMEVRQIVTNLMDNALQFTPAGREISFSLAAAHGLAVIRVGDQGVGIEPELLPKVFDRFFTTKSPRTNERGTGLGLAIVKSLAESHHGSVSVTSSPGAGAEFVVKFPLAG